MPPVLKFLRFSSGINAERDLEILDKAASIAKKNEINVEIIREASEIRRLLSEKVQSSQSHIYVCFPFEGQVFEKFKQNGFRIIGPQCVMSCLLLEVPVPKKLYPVCNVAMFGVTACCSSMKKDERNALHELILQMGGEVTGDFTSVVTHLIAKEVGSKKYQVAANNKVPIVSPVWVHTCWENSKYDHIIATSNNEIKDHILPILKGCTICVTGLDSSQRDNIKAIVEENGGTYSGELNMKTCTHLLVEYPQGAKYKYAKQWKLHCVSPSWLFDCVKEGHWLSEDPYKVEPEPDSTMSRSGNMTTRNEIQETMRNSTLESCVSKAAENAAKSLQNSKQNKQYVDCESDKRKLMFKQFQFDGIDIRNFVFQDCEKYYLDGCQIYLQNEQGPIMDCCRKIINNGGGMRLNTLEDSITHVVLWNHPSNKVKTFLLECDGVLPHVISPLWLIDSFKSGEVMDVTDYLVVEVIDKDVEEESEVFTKPDAVDASSAFATSVNKRFEEDIGDDTTLMDQYLSKNHESTRLSQVQGDNLQTGAEGSVSKATTTLDDETASMDEEPSPFLQGLTFCIQRFSEVHEANIQNLIQEYSGTVTKSLDKCDNVIVPLIYKNEEKTSNPKELTLCWLEQSIESEEMKNEKDSFLFHPISIPNNAVPLRGCVVTISQYAGMERQHLFHLAEVLGAVAQEYFVRKESKKASITLKASTHLILNKPEGSKYDASVKWNIPCVAKEWLYQCAISGRRLPEVDFSLATYSGDKTTTNGNNAKTIENTVSESGNNLVSFDFSNRGASIMDVSNSRKQQQDTVQAEEGMEELLVVEANKGPGKAHSMTANETLTNGDNEEKKVSNFHQISCGDVQEKDFTTFNHMISQEKENTIQENSKDNTVTISSPGALLQSPQFALDKSRFSFDFGNALDGMQSPTGCASQDMRRKSSRKSRGSLPLDVQFSEALQRAVDKHVPEEDRAALDESFNKKNEQLSKVLVGCVCVVSKKLANQQTSLHEIVYKLGGNTRFLYDDGCTHFIHQGRTIDMSKDYLLAKKENKCFTVSPTWLEACMASRLRVRESEYPVTYNPRMSLDVVKNQSTVEKMVSPPSAKTPKQTTKPPRDEQDARKPRVLDEPTPVAAKPAKQQMDDETKTSPEKPSMSEQQLDVQKKMEELMEATKLPRNRRQTRRQTGSSLSGTKNEAIGQPLYRRLRSKTSSQSRNSDSPNSGSYTTSKPLEVDVTSEQSQTHMITYDVDATQREARERVLEQLKRASPSQDIESVDYSINKLKLPSSTHTSRQESVPEELDVEEDDEETLDDVENQQQSRVTTNLLYDEEEEQAKKKLENAEKYKFLFSGMTVADKIKYGAIIEELGGTFLDNQYFNTQSTHIVVHCPTRSEKYLAAVASGKWILHKSYLEASREAAMFVGETDHEWGCRPEDSDFYASGKRWRMELEKERTQDVKVGAFKGWVVLLCIEASKQPGFKRILEAGGGKVLAIRPPFECIEGATHAFIGDKRQATKNKMDYRILNDAGVWILKPEFISDFLTVHPRPSAMNYILEEVSDGNNEDYDAPLTPGKRKASDRLVQKEKRHRK